MGFDLTIKFQLAVSVLDAACFAVCRLQLIVNVVTARVKISGCLEILNGLVSLAIAKQFPPQIISSPGMIRMGCDNIA